MSGPIRRNQFRGGGLLPNQSEALLLEVGAGLIQEINAGRQQVAVSAAASSVATLAFDLLKFDFPYEKGDPEVESYIFDNDDIKPAVKARLEKCLDVSIALHNAAIVLILQKAQASATAEPIPEPPAEVAPETADPDPGDCDPEETVN